MVRKLQQESDWDLMKENQRKEWEKEQESIRLAQKLFEDELRIQEDNSNSPKCKICKQFSNQAQSPLFELEEIDFNHLFHRSCFEQYLNDQIANKIVRILCSCGCRAQLTFSIIR